jgi:hypothetical protein
VGKTNSENEMVMLFLLLFTIGKVGFYFLLYYFTHFILITNAKVSMIDLQAPNEMITDPKNFYNMVCLFGFLWF